MLRPTLFSIPSSTELKVTFNKNLSESLSAENFKITSVSGNVSDLEVTKVAVSEKQVVITTKPQVAGNYYILSLKDATGADFTSLDGVALINDDSSRDLYFLGLKNYNPVRDRLVQNIPSLYKLENSNLTSLIDNQAEELFRAQKHIGELLSDNYISETVVDERRVRSSGATDRLSNENAFIIDRVSSEPTGGLSIFRSLDYSAESSISRHSSFPSYPVSTQEMAVTAEEITLGTEGASFDGFLVNLSKKNVIKLTKLILVKSGEVEDCDGNLGTEYSLSTYKYSILDNRYDEELAFSNSSLLSNQVLLSEFGNIDKPKVGDKIIASYLYRDAGIRLNEGSLEIFNLKAIPQESLPANSSRFFLNKAPIVDSNNLIPERGGISFSYGQASPGIPAEFRRELVYNASKLPSKLGEYTVNYNTGEVIVVGSERIGEGTGNRAIIASYTYRNSFVENLDYYVNNNEIVASKTRSLKGSQVTVEFTYEKIFLDGVDYAAPCHTEILNEPVENNFSTSFSISPKNTPVTDVFRIFNQTTGEVYSPLYYTDDEIFFSGRKSPEFKTSGLESANFDLIELEELAAVGEFVCPAFTIEIRTALSNSNIRFSPGIPSELINLNSQDYLIRSTGLTGGGDPEDIQIRFFGEPDSNGLIHSFGISLTAQAPSLGESVTLGPLGYVFSLEKAQVISKTQDSVGSFSNTSAIFSDDSVFVNEKYFRPSPLSPSLSFPEKGSLQSVFVSEKADVTVENVSRLRKPGDYCIDYDHGKVYLAVSKEQEYEAGFVSYRHGSSISRNPNIIAVSRASKQILPSNSVFDSAINYNSILNTNNAIKINDLETSLLRNTGASAADLSGNIEETNKILADYTIIVEHKISSINTILDEKYLYGSGLNFAELSKRIPDSAASEAILPFSDGGTNLYDSSYVTFEENVIDLKKVSKTRVVKKDGSFTIRISDSDLESIFEIKNNSTGEAITDGVVTLSSTGAVIIIPDSAAISSLDLVEVSYITDGVPSVGTKVAVDYRYGRIHFDYTYSYDNVFVSYEYGDNQIDWSIGSAIGEGEEYYVSYKYGALRAALKKNFGILTKIPFFQNFGLNIDRELYRNALQGAMQAFTNGPKKSSFGTLVKSFTDIEPDITESAFGSWILGRDLLQPEEIEVSGPISFSNSKFKEGLDVKDGTIVSVPSVSNINLDEGTFSAWVTPHWSGIDNDAEITIEIDNIGLQSYKYVLGTDVFNYDNKFSLFPSDNRIGGVDSSIPSITLHNGRTVLIDEEEVLQIGVSALAKREPSLTRATKLELGISIKIDNFSIPEKISGTSDSPPALKNGVLGLYESTHNVPGYLSASTPSQSSIGYGSPGFISIGDDNKLLFLQLALRPVTNASDGSVFYVEIDDDDLSTNDFPKYDRLHPTTSCKCTVTDTVSILSGFRDREVQTVKAEFDSAVDISHIRSLNAVLTDGPSAFKVTDSRGAIYEVYGFIDEDGEEASGAFPDKITGFLLNKIPQNHEEITAKGSEFLNDFNPLGELFLSYQIVSVLTESDTDSEKVLGYEEKAFVADWSTECLDISILRDPRKNLVTIDLLSKTFSEKKTVSLFYTDLINTSDENYIFSRFSLDDLADLPAESSDRLKDKISVGTLDKSCRAIININKLDYKITNRFSLSDIYIGKFGRNPKRNPFSISKNDSPNTSVGVPLNYETSEGVFIGFDNLCESSLSDDAGQWVFRTRAAETISLPTSVAISGSDYELESSDITVEHTFDGRILTDGEFSSVTRSYRKEDDDSCAMGLVCSAHYRYCGEDLLENAGWRKINETDSSIINLLLGGSENDVGFWTKSGSFNTSADGGVYRIGPSTSVVDPESGDLVNRNTLFGRIPCSDGDWTSTINFRVLESDFNIEGSALARFVGAVSGNLTGISPLHIFDGKINIKLLLGISDASQPVLLTMDGHSGDILDISFFDWSDGEYKELIIKNENDIISVETDSEVLSVISAGDFEDASVDSCDLLSEPFIASHLFDGSIIDSTAFHQAFTGSIVDISLIEYEGRREEGLGLLESDDVFISTDSKIEFSFVTTDSTVDGYSDGYSDGYDDGYDGYVSEVVYDVDEITFTSDKLRYLLDTGEGESKNRISIFKDGKGFLNFRIFGSSTENGSNAYNIATNIKHFKANELHHIGASWRLNTVYEKDEMHLFVDGLEAPNLFRFGGSAKARVNDKFSDVGKEVLQGFVEEKIVYYEDHTDGTILAGSSTFSSESLAPGAELLGRSLIFKDSDIAEAYIGGGFIIGPVVGSGVTILDSITLDPIVFNTSASDITFSLAPTAGISESLAADIKNGAYSVFRTDCNGQTEELGGLEYSTSGSSITLINHGQAIKPAFRANVSSKIIEFIGEDDDCNMTSSVSFSDLDIHLKTFGLLFRKVKTDIALSSSSYDDSRKDELKSALFSHGVEPVSLSDVSVKRIIKTKYIPEFDEIDPVDDFYLGTFETSLENSIGTFKVSSESGQLDKENKGRQLSVVIDSDNIKFCKEITDGYADSLVSKITISGKTTDGSNSEEFYITGNGLLDGEKFFTSVESISGELIVADTSYESCVLEVIEKDPVTVGNNDGEYAEITRYINGALTLKTSGSDSPFELHPGSYRVEFPAFLNIKIPQVGPKLYLGSDMNGKGQFNGILDECKIITEMSNDTRPTALTTSGTRSITEEYLNPNPSCPDDQTILLSHFDNPIKLQSRRLRQKVFLNTDHNYRFKLDHSDREVLLASINDREAFESKMIRMGFSKDQAVRTFFECHKAQGGPVFNEAKLLRSDDMLVSFGSVNSHFGQAAKFFETAPLVIQNNLSFFRKDKGSIEFWVSPLLNTYNDPTKRTYVEISSVDRKRVESTSPTSLRLPAAAKKILGIKLIENKEEFSSFYSQTEVDNIIFDEIYRSEITGRLAGGTGVKKDFSRGSTLSPNGRDIALKDALPGSEVDVIVTYIPRDSAGDIVSIYKDADSQIVFSIKTNDEEHKLVGAVDWERNSWHRIRCDYKTGSSSDMMRLFIDGEDQAGFVYGEDSSIYNETDSDITLPSINSLKTKKIKLSDDFRLILIGGESNANNSALARMDNIRFSRAIREEVSDPNGNKVDLNYSSNINTILPVIKDSITTLLLNFDQENTEEKYATIIDPENGIFNFDIDVIDDFGKINKDEIEDLITELVNTLKPSHTNALVKFPRESC
jgi:hypothetical protein